MKQLHIPLKLEEISLLQNVKKSKSYPLVIGRLRAVIAPGYRAPPGVNGAPGVTVMKLISSRHMTFLVASLCIKSLNDKFT